MIRKALLKETISIGKESHTTQFLTSETFELSWSPNGEFLVATEKATEGMTYMISRERVAWTASPKEEKKK
jgi:hypothetical protein